MNSDKTYRRVTIRGELIALSDLHLGSGGTGERGEDEKAIQVNELALDCAKRPILPGASLRGYLAAQVGEENPGFIELFGAARYSGDEQAGALRIYDGRLIGAENEEIIRSRIAIEPVTRTAKENHLFNDILTPRGSRFHLEISLDNISNVALNTLLQALTSFNPDNPTGQMGQGKSHGRGQMQWQCCAIRGLSEEAFKTWLNSDKPLQQAAWETINMPPANPRNQWRAIPLRYYFDSPILINDPAIVSGKKNEPDLRFMRRGDKLLIPGSSIKGIFRARARRILLTLCGDNEKTDTLTEQMFGGTDGMSIIRFYDVLAPVGKEEVHEQTMIAVDRFTGGVKDGAMINVEAARPKPAKGVVAMSNQAEDWQRALWLYCLRDAMEGDLALGWGQARGFGAFHIELETEKGGQQNWPGYWQSIESKADKWVEALNKALHNKEEKKEAVA